MGNQGTPQTLRETLVAPKDGRNLLNQNLVRQTTRILMRSLARKILTFPVRHNLRKKENHLRTLEKTQMIVTKLAMVTSLRTKWKSLYLPLRRMGEYSF
jgi:hypothetical protein